LKDESGNSVYPVTGANLVDGLSDVAKSGDYNDLENKPTIQTINTVNVSVDNNTGTPSATGTVSGSTITLNFHNLKGQQGQQGQQGNTGSSVDYPYELVNNLITDDATKGLSAAQGVVLEGEVSQLRSELDGNELIAKTSFIGGWYIYKTNPYYKTNNTARVGVGEITLDAGDIISLTDYSACRMYVGYRDANGYNTPGAWLTSDYTAPVSGIYVITLDGIPAVPVSDTSDLTKYLRVIRGLSQVYRNEVTLNELESDVARKSTNNDLSNQLYCESLTQGVEYELGNILITNSAWTYEDSVNRVRTPSDYILHLFPGDKITLSNYSGVRFYVGARYVSGSMSMAGWLTSDYIVQEEGYFCVLVANTTDTQQLSPDTLGQLIKVVRNTTVRSMIGSGAASVIFNNTGTTQVIGNRIDLVGQNYSVAYIGQEGAGVDTRQGGAIFGDYLFQFHNTLESIVVFKLSTATTVQTFSLTAQPDCHANSGGFGKTYHTAGDPFPLLYVSSQSEKKIYVYRITGEEGNWSIALVQTITVNVDFYLPNIAIDAWNERGVLFGYTKNSWSDTTAKSRICWFNLPPLSSGDVTISDFNDYFTLPYIYAQQGACARFGKMYLSFGNTQQGQATGGIIVIDYTNKNVDSYLDLYAIAPGSFEPEAIGIWGGGLIVTSAGGGVYKLTVN